MLITPEHIEFLRSLRDPEPHWGGTGARYLHPDTRDFPAEWHPIIAQRMEVPLPRSASLLSFIRLPRLNQGQEGSCVAFSTCGDCQMDHSEADGGWPGYDGHRLYAEAGGSGSSGVDARTVLSIVTSKGTPLLNGTRDMVIKSYVFVDRTPGTFRNQIKAAISAGSAVLVASLLPIPFGWNTGMTLSTGYHQYLGVAFDTDAQNKEWLTIMNTWGELWPGDAPPGTPPGVGRISFDALEQNNLQNGYTYAIIPTAISITPTPPPPPPPPPPVNSRKIGGTASGTGVSSLAVGQSLDVQGAAFTGKIALTSVEGDGDHNNPPPPPPPPGDLKVIIATQRRGGVIWAQAQDASGQYVTGTASGTVGSTALPARSCSRIPAVWQVPGASGTVTVNVTAGDGRQGSGQGTL